jgi:RNA polymerase sigma factor (sigma-70 family)
MKIFRKEAGAPNPSSRFEELALPHLDAAYNLARWLVRNEQDAQDLVQEAYLRALKFFASFRGESARTWLLTIVRHTCYSWLKENRMQGSMTPFDEELHGKGEEVANQELQLLQNADAALVREALEKLPVEFREVIVLREMEGFSYKEISEMANIPLGTVMSRLARGRKWLHELLASRLRKQEA